VQLVPRQARENGALRPKRQGCDPRDDGLRPTVFSARLAPASNALRVEADLDCPPRGCPCPGSTICGCYTLPLSGVNGQPGLGVPASTSGFSNTMPAISGVTGIDEALQ